MGILSEIPTYVMIISAYFGEVSEWLKEAVSKTVVRFAPYRGFESHPLRHLNWDYFQLCSSCICGKMNVTVLDGEVAVPCNPQSAIAGSNTCLRQLIVEVWSKHVVLTIGFCATETHEPRQVRKEAAVSELFRVPQGRLV